VRRAANYIAAAALSLAGVTGAATPVVTQDVMIPAQDAGIELHLRNLHPARQEKFDDRKILLFVHGATFPSTVAFDFDMPGGSWMRQLAAAGYDTWALDIRGYGGSTRPQALDEPPEANSPFAGTADAARDIAAAVDHILKRRGASALNVVGWSWGTTTTPSFAAAQPGKVRKLVLISPVWLPMNPPPFKGAWRASTHDGTRAFMTSGIPKERLEEISPAAQFERWWAATLATDPEGAKRAPPILRSPNGVMQDFHDIWGAGESAYDPAAIRAPTLLIVGEWDTVTPPAMAIALYPRLTSAADRRLVLLAQSTHFMALESHRARLFAEVQSFLEE
jgi:pimeloyl-ACP methyl ester carboxylesterase